MRYVDLPTPEVFITGGDVSAGKPSPEGYLLAAKRLNVKPWDCVVVEDAPAGIQAGKAAGMRIIGIASSISKDALDQADIIVQQLADVRLQVTKGTINIQLK
jgi:sugar-phosphatase